MCRFLTLLATALSPTFVSAHEVYVLDQDTIGRALAADSQNPFLAYVGNEWAFFMWGLVSVIVLSTILFATAFKLFEERAHRSLSYIKRFAHPLVRATVAITLIAFSFYGTLYGPEIRLTDVFGDVATLVRIILGLSAAAIALGLHTRVAALALIVVYAAALALEGWYVLGYVDHLGAYVLLLVLGGGAWSLDNRDARLFPAAAIPVLRRLAPLVFPLLRLTFGASIVFAALYAKFFHSELAVQVVLHYELTRFFPFDPLFVVLGALIIETLAGVMMFFGIAVRWTALFLAFWLTMGHIYTTEFWWVHVILYGVALAIFCHGYDKWSLEGRLFKKRDREPVL